jgi:hypothetical protein
MQVEPLPFGAISSNLPLCSGRHLARSLSHLQLGESRAGEEKERYVVPATIGSKKLDLPP